MYTLPKMYVISQIGRFNQFLLEEGVDSRGVSTVFLTCNCSTKLIVDNKSYVFGLHIHPPSIKFFFGPLNFAKMKVSLLYIPRNVTFSISSSYMKFTR